MSWTTVFLDKSKGGLGVRCLSSLNKALICKWNWGFTMEREVCGKYREVEGGLLRK